MPTCQKVQVCIQPSRLCVFSLYFSRLNRNWQYFSAHNDKFSVPLFLIQNLYFCIRLGFCLQTNRKNEAQGMTAQNLTGYPSIDKPWLKYYTEEAINAPLPEGSMYDYMAEHTAGFLDKNALSYFSSKISYRCMLKKIRDAASAFSAVGVKAGDIVAVALPNIPENIYCIYALNMLGAVVDMIDLRSKGDLLLHYISESSAKVAVVCDMFAENMYAIADKTLLETLILVSPLAALPFPLSLYKRSRLPRCANAKQIMRWEKFISNGSDVDFDINRNSDSVACIAHTSGTTGMSKGVMLTNRNINTLVSQYISIGFEHDITDRMLNQVPPFLAYSFLSFHFPFALHLSVTLLPDYRPDKFADNLLKYKPNHVFAGPGDWLNLLSKSEKNIKYDSLKSLASGSDHLDEKSKAAITNVLEKAGCHYKILEGYGMTECCSAASTQLPSHIVDDSVGIPLPKSVFCIYDTETNSELPYDNVGEVCICSPCVMKGYFKNEKETSNVLRLHRDGKLWLHTGDLGRIDRDGNVFLIGRLKRVIIRYDGIKLYPLNLENAIRKHPAVSACCAVGSPDTIHGRGFVPVAFVTLVRGYDTAAAMDELIALCKAELSDKYCPDAFFFVETLPLTSNGKVDYRALERMAAEDK